MFISFRTRPGAPRCLLALSAQLRIAAEHLLNMLHGQENRRQRNVFAKTPLATDSYLGSFRQLGDATHYHCFRMRRSTVAKSFSSSLASCFAT